MMSCQSSSAVPQRCWISLKAWTRGASPAACHSAPGTPLSPLRATAIRTDGSDGPGVPLGRLLCKKPTKPIAAEKTLMTLKDFYWCCHGHDGSSKMREVDEDAAAKFVFTVREDRLSRISFLNALRAFKSSARGMWRVEEKGVFTKEIFRSELQASH